MELEAQKQSSQAHGGPLPVGNRGAQTPDSIAQGGVSGRASLGKKSGWDKERKETALQLGQSGVLGHWSALSPPASLSGPQLGRAE